jgi:Ciliary BBSome complex subunit 2, middle region/Ciliary BBSome complex subunit 2, N-terminal/Ciliary BBSome complex subunit 2, C-terminal
LVCGIVGGKLIVHTPHKTEEINSAGETRLLNINKKMVSLTAGCIQFNSEKEVLMIATQNNLKVYDVIENSDLFYHEVSDGICSVVFGSLAPLKRPVVIIGGNCFVNGFDENGDEVYWVVGGDNVLSMVLCDIDDDSTNELITGWEDYSIRVFKGEYQWLDVTESAAVVKLAAFSTRMFAFGLANGTIGAYLVKARAWSYKTKEKIISIVPFNDSRNDPFAFIFVYASGLIEARELVKGTVIGSEKLGTPLVYGVRCDYRMQGSEQLLVVQTNGGVKGFDVNNKPLVVIKKEGEKENEEEEVSMRPENDITAQNASEFGDLLIELQRKKAELNIELNQFNNQKKSSNLTADMVIPNTTQLFCDYVYPSGVRYPCLQLKTNNSSIIKALIVYGEKLFEKDHSAM